MRESTCFIFSSWLPLKKIFFSAVFAVLECFFFFGNCSTPFPSPAKKIWSVPHKNLRRVDAFAYGLLGPR